MIILKGKNFVEEHDEPIIVSYTFDRPRMLVEPFLLVAGYFAFFVVCSIVARSNVVAPKSTDNA